MKYENFSPEVAEAVGQIILQSQIGQPLIGAGINFIKAPVSPQPISSEEYNALLQMPLWQMTGAQYKTLTESIFNNLVALQQQKPQKNFVYGIEGLAKLLHKSRNTAQRLKSSGIIDEAISQDGRTIVIDADRALELIHKHDVEEKARKHNCDMSSGKEAAYV